MEIIAQGAEAVIVKEGNIIRKVRIPKSYRLQTIDNQIRKLRTRKEKRILEKAAQIIPVPKVINHSDKDMTIEMEYIEGTILSSLTEHNTEIAHTIGKQLALLHNNHIIHGDVTTSNMIKKGNKIYFIDFGLSFIDPKTEHKAVDIHLLRQALYAKHHEFADIFYTEILATYLRTIDNPEEFLDRLARVERRGRYKKGTINKT